MHLKMMRFLGDIFSHLVLPGNLYSLSKTQSVTSCPDDSHSNSPHCSLRVVATLSTYFYAAFGDLCCSFLLHFCFTHEIRELEGGEVAVYFLLTFVDLGPPLGLKHKGSINQGASRTQKEHSNQSNWKIL